jgi:hypothetical protein
LPVSFFVKFLYNKQNVEEEWKGDSGSAEEMERIVYKAYQM